MEYGWSASKKDSIGNPCFLKGVGVFPFWNLYGCLLGSRMTKSVVWTSWRIAQSTRSGLSGTTRSPTIGMSADAHVFPNWIFVLPYCSIDCLVIFNRGFLKEKPCI